MVTKVLRNIVRRINGKDPTKEQEDFLLDRLGGMVVLSSIVNEFCRRATDDERLAVFFQGVDPQVLMAHQHRFFALAFTTIDKQKAEATILRAHSRLFTLGLSECHFDVFSFHLEQTLRDRGFKDSIVGEAHAVMAPLRDIFQKGAQQHKRMTSTGKDRGLSLGTMVASLKRSTLGLFRVSGANSERDVHQPVMAA